MLFKKTPVEDPMLTKAIQGAHDDLEAYDADSAEYAKIVIQLEKLYALQAPEKAAPVSPDALIAVAGNLVGILMILNFERLHVVTTKALGFVLKSKM